MGTLSYGFNISLDGYISDADGDFDWSEPDEEVHQFWNDRERDVQATLYGRRLYETMAVWETIGVEGESPDEEVPPVMVDYAQAWRAQDKIVYSKTLADVTTSRTRLEREFDAEAVRRYVAEADGTVSIGGASLASHALRAGIVDRLDVLIYPVIVGGGTRWLPDDIRLDLQLTGERRFDNGVAHLGYRVRR